VGSYGKPEAVIGTRFETGTSEYGTDLLITLPCHSDYVDRTSKEKWSKIMRELYKASRKRRRETL
jgi:hypothetical protein